MKLANWLNNLLILLLALTGVSVSTNAQERSITLEEAYQKSRNNYPLIRQKDLLRQTENLNISNLSKGYLPQLSLNGQATYQSEVTQVSIPIPGITINPQSKDQYKMTADVNQLIFDGGITGQQQKIQQLNTLVEEQKIEVELYKLRDRISQIYLGSLYLDEQLKQVELIKRAIQIGFGKTEAQVKNGVAFRSNLDVLKAELLKTEQRAIELQASRQGLIQTLALFMGENLNEATKLEQPANPLLDTEIRRPEVNLYGKQINLLEQQKGLLLSKNLPRANLFAQGGYGRPGLNVLKNEFDWFYLAGLRLNWTIGGFYTYKNEKKLVDINKQTIDIQRETFLLNTNTQLTQQLSEVKKLNQFITSDEEIIALREKITTAAKAQLENGVITANDYLREVNAEDQARQTQITHKLQLLQAQINYTNLTGY